MGHHSRLASSYGFRPARLTFDARVLRGEPRQSICCDLEASLSPPERANVAHNVRTRTFGQTPGAESFRIRRLIGGAITQFGLAVSPPAFHSTPVVRAQEC